MIGIAGFFDLRLMGFMKRVPVSAARDLMPLAIGGFGLNVATGMIFFVGTRHQYVGNIAFWAKLLFLCSPASTQCSSKMMDCVWTIVLCASELSEDVGGGGGECMGIAVTQLGRRLRRLST